MYSGGLSEEVTGRALKKLGLRREETAIATKAYYPMGATPNECGTSKKHVRHAIDGSLRRLGVDYVDLYQIHRYDRTTPIEETLAALTDVVNQGKALYIGASSMYAWEFAKFLSLAERHGYVRFVAMQNHYNLVYREEEREVIPLCREEKIGIIPWSPLARGFLAGNRSGQPPVKPPALSPISWRIAFTTKIPTSRWSTGSLNLLINEAYPMRRSR
jgi:1-deoxyxylulose-5-phosphate synthase